MVRARSRGTTPYRGETDLPLDIHVTQRTDAGDRAQGAGRESIARNVGHAF